MTRHTAATSLSLILSCLSLARAQEPARSDPPLAEHEQAWVAGLQRALGGTARTQRMVLSLPRTAEAGAGEEPGAAQARGLHVALSDLHVYRLRFPDAPAATRWAEGPDTGLVAGSPRVAQLRAEQVVVVIGERVRDAAFGRRALETAWREMLHAEGAPETTLAQLGQDELLVATRDGTSRLGKLLSLNLALPSSKRTAPHRAGRNESGLWAVFAATPARLDALQRYLEELTQGAPPPAPPESPFEDARRR